MTNLPRQVLEQVEKRVADFNESASLAGLTPPCIAEIPGHPLRVWACSDYVVNSCIRHPSVLIDLMDSGDLLRSYAADIYPAKIEAALEGDDDTALMRGLRKCKRREMVRIAWRDISGLASFEETVGETSQFADAILDAALRRVHESLARERGDPVGEDGSAQALIVLALGKLGAQELNFSSDIDLIFGFAQSGATTGATRALSNEEFFIRLARRFINLMSKTTEDGFVFRVDMRLRPFGAGGPLVSSLAAMEDYYYIHGRDWERYALIRARPVAGDIEQGEEFLERLRPFIYRRYIDFGALESLRDMKALIRAEVARKGMQQNVKLGPGGIREIEFVGQAFQMVRGGRIPALRDRQILSVLSKLAEHDFLPRYVVDELTEGYRVLRTTEHRLQQVDDQQTHALPDDAWERLRLSVGMGFESWSAFEPVLERHRDRVQSHFDQVFGAQTQGEEEDPDDLFALWEGTLDESEARACLNQAGFDEADNVIEVLSKLRASYPLRSLGERGRSRIGRLMPILLRVVSQRQHLYETLRRTLSVIESIARRSVYLALLAERPLALAQLVKLCDASPMITRQFARHPMLLDELLDARTLYSPLGRLELEEDLESRLSQLPPDDTEQEMDSLRHFKQSNVLRIAAADVAGAIPLEQVSRHLTEVAEIALEQTLKLAKRDLISRHGAPTYKFEGEVHPAPFAVVAYGKFGGWELGYGSDLDLVFLHGSHGEDQNTDGERPIENTVFFVRLAQRIIHFLSTHTAAGILYTADARLRPSGSDGLLVTSLENFAAYQFEEAWTWEHQAIVRARYVAGDRVLEKGFEDIRMQILLKERAAEDLRKNVRDMRERMRRQLGSSTKHSFDIKQDTGGIADIEFMVQYAALRWSHKLRNSLQFTDNCRLLESMGATGLLEPGDVSALTDAYNHYRAQVHAQALQERSGKWAAADFAAPREAVSAVWRKLMED